jgi:ATP-binding cassette subfamily B protein
MRRGFGYLRPYWKLHVIIGLGVVFSLAFDVGLPYSLRYIIDFALNNLAGLQTMLLGLGFLFVLAAVGRLAQDYAMADISRQLKYHMRLEFFGMIQNLPLGAISGAQPGQLSALFGHELTVLSDALRTLAADGLQASLQVVATLVLLALVNLPLTLMLLLVAPLSYLFTRRLVRGAAAAEYADKTGDAAVTHWVQDNVQAQPILRSLGLSELTLLRFRKFLDPTGATRHTLRMGFKAPYFLNRLVTTFSDLQRSLTNSLVVGVGAILIYRGTLSVGEFLAFYTLQAGLGNAISRLAEFARGQVAAAASLTRLDEVRSTAMQRPMITGNIELPRLHEAIEIDQVSFGYGDNPVLFNADLTIPANKTVALVGRSGSGKSSLLGLILRLYQPNLGRIRFDGHDLQQVTTSSLYAQIGFVPQDSGLLNLSVRDNIRLAQPEATHAEVEEAARQAEIHDVIRKLPHGYDTILLDGGRLLSPGQRQRVALARAILRDPAILILDEATSALDPETESQLFRTIRKLGADRTVLIVTHRLTVAASADYIYILDQGRVAEHGTWRKLLLANGIFQRLWSLQSGFLVSGDGSQASITAERVGAVPLFAGLEPAILETLATKFRVQRFAQGNTILEQGDAGENFYIIVRGQVQVSLMGRDGQDIHLAILEDGEYFGEIALLEGGATTATVRASLPTLCLCLRHTDFQALLDSQPAMRSALSDTMLRRSLEQTIAQGRAASNQPDLFDRLSE